MDNSATAPDTQNFTRKQLQSLAISILDFHKDGRFAYDPEATRQKDIHNTMKCNLTKVLDYSINQIPDKKALLKEIEQSPEKFVNKLVKLNLGPYVEGLYDRAKFCDEEWQSLLDSSEMRERKAKNELYDLKKERINIDEYCKIKANELFKEMKLNWVSEKEDIMAITNQMMEWEDKYREQLRKNINTAAKTEAEVNKVRSEMETMRLAHEEQRETWTSQLKELTKLKSDREKFEAEKQKWSERVKDDKHKYDLQKMNLKIHQDKHDKKTCCEECLKKDEKISFLKGFKQMCKYLKKENKELKTKFGQVDSDSDSD
jgi:hypothetical protein